MVLKNVPLTTLNETMLKEAVLEVAASGLPSCIVAMYIATCVAWLYSYSSTGL